MPAIDVCFFISRHDWQQQKNVERALEPFIRERIEVDRYQDGYDSVTRYVVRIWSEKIAQELFAELAEACIHPNSDIYFSLPDDAVSEADAHDLIEDFLPAIAMIRRQHYDAFLPRTTGKTKVLSYDIFLALPEEEKRAVAERFKAALLASGVITEGRNWCVYIPKYL